MKRCWQPSFVLLLFLLFFEPANMTGQLCMDPANVVYGLTNAGTIHPITVSTGAVGAQMNPLTGNAPVASNGIGYSPLNGKFYYFKRMPGSAPQEFVCFDPASNLYTMLSNCPTTNYIYVGGINRLGTGYYCWDSNATLYYYSIATDTWTTITNSIIDDFGVDVSAIVRAHGSGDLAIDGVGNLIMLPSSNSRFAVYRMNAPLPTAPVASIVVNRLMPLTNPPAKFGGIALNATGEIFLNATTPTNGLYRLNQNFTLTFLSTVATGMGDLTSCNFPFGVLAEGIENFRVQLLMNGDARLSWENYLVSPKFTIEHSTDGKKWLVIGSVDGNSTDLQYTHQPAPGKNNYRVCATVFGQMKLFSEIRSISIDKEDAIFIASPVKEQLLIVNHESTVRSLLITDIAGRQLLKGILQPGINAIDCAHLKRGYYYAILTLKNGKRKTIKLFKA